MFPEWKQAFFLENGADAPLGEAVFAAQLAAVVAVVFLTDGVPAQRLLQGVTLGDIQSLAAGDVDDAEHLVHG